MRRHLISRSGTSSSRSQPLLSTIQLSWPRRPRMKRVALLSFLAGWLVPLATAPDHFQVGAYADYFRISPTNPNEVRVEDASGEEILTTACLEGRVSDRLS